MVEWSGRPLRLTPLPFRLLLALATKPGRGVTYRELVDRIWQGKAIVEQQQVNDHRRTVTRALATVMEPGEARALITTNAGQGMVLNLAPEEVQVVP
jgi:DNA-binding response OmpR family regulator